jgi:DNA mismatch repair ATPase MutL
MRDMSEHMSEMSQIMKKDNISQQEMDRLHDQMHQTQKRYDMLHGWE